MLTVRTLLNELAIIGLIPGVNQIPLTGSWDAAVANALHAIERQYFFGVADPNAKLENDDTLFRFLAHTAATKNSVASSLSAEAYQLAAVMVPGGADITRLIRKKARTVVNGKTFTHIESARLTTPGNIRVHLPNILTALTSKSLNDTDMLMMALATIRAESASFRPISEGISKYNTSSIKSEGHHAFDLYDHRTDLGQDGHGEGAKWKGRGFVQLTGRSNYINIGAQVGATLEQDPELANDPIIASKILAQFLKNHETAIRHALSENDLRTARRLVNGGSHGLTGFIRAFSAGRNFLGIVVSQRANTTTKGKPRQRK
ncbi:MAG: hypothetical protein JSS05_07650 [Proteobacteria bacterium]|nr:hypothetical protein [Pseudomonadota bacterium]